MTRILYASGLLAVGVLFVVAMRVPDAEVPVTGTLHEHGLDADSFHLDTAAGESIEFRLAGGVDAPELAHLGMPWGHVGQPGGQEARQALLAFVGHDPVTCTPTGAETHRRAVAACTVRGVDLSTWLLSHGWAYSSTYGKCRDTLPLVEKAQAERLGIFGLVPEHARVPPAVWRGHRSDLCAGEKS